MSPKDDPGKVPGADAFGFHLFVCFLLAETLFDIKGENIGRERCLDNRPGLNCVW